MFKFISWLTAALLIAPPATAKITRHCDAKIHWQTTGGSLSGSFGKKMGALYQDRAFSAPGTCGNNKGNECRRRARDTMMGCLAAHRDALRANPNATRPSACHSVKHYDYGWAHIGAYDVLDRVSAEVCCRGAMGSFNFSDESDVRINLWARISGSTSSCNGEVRLYDNLRVNCTTARRQCPDLKE